MSKQKSAAARVKSKVEDQKSASTQHKGVAWNVRRQLPRPSGTQQRKGLKSASDIVNEALKSLCYLFGKRNPDKAVYK